MLDSGSAVAHQKQAVVFMKPLHRLLRPGQEVVADGEIMLVAFRAGGRLYIDSQLLKQRPKPVHQNFRPGHNPQFQLLPMPFVDLVVAVQHFLCRLHAELTDGLAQSDPLGLVKIQNGVVQV